MRDPTRDLTPEDAPSPPSQGETIIIIDGIPTVGPEKVEKLQNVIGKVMRPFGTVVQINMPINKENNKGMGFCFVEFSTKEQALEAVSLGNGYRLDKRHLFKITSMADFEKYINTPEEWQPPSDEEFEEKENLQSWLLNPRCEDQIVVRHDWDCDIHWCHKNDTSSVQSRQRWSDAENHAPVAWSPKGTYLATFHKLGICLWGGKNWARVARFSHSSVKLIEISPCEKYIVTWSSDTPSNKNDPQQIIIWDIKSGEKKRGFEAEGDPSWPVFKWSHDDKYFARLKAGEAISIYVTPSMELLDKKSLKIPDVQAFSWSPSDNVITYWTPEKGERPARLTIMGIPERKELATKNLYQVKDCKLIWQKNGDHLCVYVERWTKSKKQTYTQFMLFHMKKKLIPCDLLDMKDKIEHFAWEPIGTKFAIIHGDAPARMTCSVYDLSEDKLILVKDYERVEANVLFWSPRGRHLVIAGMGNLQGIFQFVDTKDTESKEMGSGQHISATECEWDPTGRYVITSVSAWNNIQHDTGYMVWSFQGSPLQRNNIPKFFQVLWRPRPATLLNREELEDVERTYKSYQSQFEAEDKLQRSRATQEVLEARRAKMEEWESFQSQAKDRLVVWKLRMEQLRPPIPEEEMQQEEVEEIVEVFIKEDIEVISR
eukprot:m.333935 g.333935  ORF g.333935 m.333935 type:complete len:656 (+) comp17247_c0_seq1:73-2040(+)